jgi:hypothetical protein
MLFIDIAQRQFSERRWTGFAIYSSFALLALAIGPLNQ